MTVGASGPHVEDVFTRECLAVEVDTSLISTRVVAVLDRLVQTRGAPASISVDNGSEFYSRTTDTWAYQAGPAPTKLDRL